jgi:hypothetical protein
LTSNELARAQSALHCNVLKQTILSSHVKPESPREYPEMPSGSPGFDIGQTWVLEIVEVGKDGGNKSNIHGIA